MSSRENVVSEITSRTGSRFDERRLRAIAMWAERAEDGPQVCSDPTDVVDLSAAAQALMAIESDRAA